MASTLPYVMAVKVQRFVLRQNQVRGTCGDASSWNCQTDRLPIDACAIAPGVFEQVLAVQLLGQA